MLVCSGGAGTLLEALEMDKEVLVVPNRTLQDNHQIEIVEELEGAGYITSLPLNDLPNGDEIQIESLLNYISKVLEPRSRKRWGTPKADIYPILKELLYS